MNTEDLDKEIDRTQLRMAQAINPVEQLEWATHLRELLALRRKILSGENREQVVLPAFSENELAMIVASRTCSAIEVSPNNMQTLALLVRRLMARIEAFNAGESV